jgi:hypothetical protein
MLSPEPCRDLATLCSLPTEIATAQASTRASTTAKATSSWIFSNIISPARLTLSSLYDWLHVSTILHNLRPCLPTLPFTDNCPFVPAHAMDFCTWKEPFRAISPIIIGLAVWLRLLCIFLLLDPDRYQPDILHDLEHTLKQQLERKYSVSHPSNASRVGSALKIIADIDKRRAHWQNMKRCRAAAAADYGEGVAKWYYDKYPDYAKRKDQRRQQYRQVVELGRKIEEARDRALRTRNGGKEARDARSSLKLGSTLD